MTSRVITLQPTATPAGRSADRPRIDPTLAGSLACELLEAGHSPRLLVRGVSMLPTIREGDVVELARAEDGARPGDIIAFHRGPCICLHRVVSLVRENGALTGYLTAGDGLLADDGIQPASALIGHVVRVQTPDGTWSALSPEARLHGALRTYLGLHPRLRALLRHSRDALRRATALHMRTERTGVRQ